MSRMRKLTLNLPSESEQGVLKESKTSKESKYELSRSTKIIKTERDGSKHEYQVNFDDLEDRGLLGRGGFGVVKKMFHSKTNSTFAVKMVNAEEVMELEVASRIGDQCTFLLKLYGALRAEGYLWLLSELMDTSLDKFYMKCYQLNMPISESFFSKVSFAIINGLNCMRAHELIHRDVKPSNFLLNSRGEIKLCDFGISGRLSGSIAQSFVGCDIYMSPERITCSSGKGYSIKSDLWSLGISLIEMANGEHPYKNFEYLKLVAKIIDDDPPTLDSNKFSAEFCQFVKKCLIKEPNDRPKCNEILDDAFIKNHLNDKLNLEWINQIIDEIKKDHLE